MYFTLIKLVATLEHGDTTVLRHRSWTTKLHTATFTSLTSHKCIVTWVWHSNRLIWIAISFWRQVKCILIILLFLCIVYRGIPWAIKKCHSIFIRNCEKSRPIIKILSLLDSAVNLQQGLCHISHRTLNVSLYYLVKYKSSIIAMLSMYLVHLSIYFDSRVHTQLSLFR